MDNVENDDLSRKAIEALEIVDVHLASCRASPVSDAFLLPERGSYRFRTRQGLREVIVADQDSEGKRLVTILYGMGVQFVEPNDDYEQSRDGSEQSTEVVQGSEGVLGVIEGVVAAHYVCKAPDLSDEAISFFARHHVLYNVWPYWRAAVHDMTTRLSWPTVVLPLLKFINANGKGSTALKHD